MDNNEEQVDLSDAFKKPTNQESIQPEKLLMAPDSPKSIQWVIKFSGGLIKTEKQASYVLLALIALIAIIAIFISFGANKPSPRDLKYEPDTIYGGKDVPDNVW